MYEFCSLLTVMVQIALLGNCHSVLHVIVFPVWDAVCPGRCDIPPVKGPPYSPCWEPRTGDGFLNACLASAGSSMLAHLDEGRVMQKVARRPGGQAGRRAGGCNRRRYLKDVRFVARGVASFLFTFADLIIITTGSDVIAGRQQVKRVWLWRKGGRTVSRWLLRNSPQWPAVRRGTVTLASHTSSRNSSLPSILRTQFHDWILHSPVITGKSRIRFVTEKVILLS